MGADYWSELDAAYYQIDLMELPLHRQFNLIHTWFKNHYPTEEGVEMFEAMLNEPLEWEKRMPKRVHAVADDEIAMMRAAAEGF